MTQAAAQSHPFSAVHAVFFSFAIFGPLLVINAFQTLSILWKPISLKWFRKYNNFWANHYWSYVGWAARSIGGIEVEMLGDRIPRNENALVLANHQSAVDIVVQLIVGKTVERLGDMKFFVKDILKWVPGPGWGMVFLECIFMKRNWTEDRHRVVKQLQKFRQDRVPVLGEHLSRGHSFKSIQTGKHSRVCAKKWALYSAESAAPSGSRLSGDSRRIRRSSACRLRSNDCLSA